MHCPRCQHENAPRIKFCGECGTPLTTNPSGPPAPSYAEITSALTESLEQQTATAEILRVISSSPTDVQPVFDTIVESVVRLCDGIFTTVFRFDGELIHPVAYHRSIGPEGQDVHQRRYPRPPGQESVVARAILERTVIHVPDVESDQDVPAATRELARTVGYQSVLAVPMLREGNPIGALGIGRRELNGKVRPFSDREIELLRTFADQAVIAIENVRLFTELGARNRELTEALDQQTATSEILGVISSSPTDIQPVFDAIARSATGLCEASNTGVFRFDGDLIHLVAHHNWAPEALDAVRRVFPRTPGRASAVPRATLTRAVIHITDITEDLEYTATPVLQVGFRTVLAVPMLREEHPIGAISVARMERRPFTDTQVALLKTFADQAVIAIENVRLFTELEARNRDLTESLEQQTATAEILRVISSSPTDLQPVMEVVAENAARFCGATNAAIFELEGESLRLVALHGPSPGSVPIGGTVTASPGNVAGRVIRDRRTIHIEDVLALPDTEFPETLARQRRAPDPTRTVLATPLLREGVPIGIIWMRRTEVRSFTDKQIALAKTFADQAVIAIENVRLFKELEARNRELSESLEQQTATSELLKVIGRSTFDLQPVFETLAENAVRLCGAKQSSIFRFDGRLLRVVATHNASPETRAFLEQNPIAPGATRARRALPANDAPSTFTMRGATPSTRMARFR
jgi:two-component system, NtrC family, sensor kinase